MRNLCPVDSYVAACSLFKTCHAATVERNLIYFINDNEICKLEMDSLDPEKDVEVLVPFDMGRVLDMKFLPEEDILALVTQSGSIAIFSMCLSEMEVVGDVTGGIAATCWSPDMEVLVVISEEGKVLMMTRMWDVVHEEPLFQDEFGEANFVSVGWGSKETQFHGSEGKHNRSKKEIQTSLAEWDDQKTRIVWRADGLYFAVNALDPTHGHRTVRVFNREGHLQSTSETVSQLEQSLSWKSSGASGLITTTISLPQQGKHQVGFFEKNGLRHGEFDIPSSHQVLETFWNGDSTILAVFICSGEEEYGIQLWTMSNYHWYMKQLISFSKNTRPLWISWDLIETNRIHFITSDGTYHKNDYRTVVDSSKGLTANDPACIAVTDNKTLKLTFLREAIIPPPMCGWEMEFSAVIHSIDLTGTNSLCVVTHDGNVRCFQLTCNDSDCKEEGFKVVRREGRRYQPSWMSSYSFDFSNYSELRQIKWVNSTTLIASRLNQLLVFNVNESHDSPGKITVKQTFELETRVSLLVLSREQDVVFIHLISGKTMQLKVAELQLVDCENGRFTESCTQLDYIDGHLVGLSSSGRLYVDAKELLSGISSFSVHSDFLLLTSVLNHQLLCVALKDIASSDKLTERAIERGAKLIHAVPMATSVVLQMPRGNLETVHPRALTLNILKSMIDRQSYSEALTLMKRQRINLNLVFDHNPEAFFEHCSKFVQEISSGDVSNLNIFLSELQNEDFTSTMYRSHYQERLREDLDTKIERVCVKMRNVMEETDAQKLLLPILTSYVKQGSVDLALRTVQTLDDELAKNKALKYLAVLVDGDKLYKEALVTYDLQLTLMVAQRSQKDPKEYLAFLNELNVMEDEYFRRFTIDNSLKRYAPALRHLCLCRPVKTEQIIRYMKLHRIFTPAIDELCSTPILEEAKQALQMAATLQAETLKSRDSCEEAGYLYQRVELYDEALTCFQKCGLSQQCLALASILQFSELETRELVSKLVGNLRAAKRYNEAASLCEHHLKDYQQSGQCLIENLCFSEAWALTNKYQMKEWAETTLQTELEEAFKSVEIKLEHVESECCRYTQRLAVVRNNLLYKLEHPQEDMDHGDLYSETGSSIYTHSTGTSGKTFMSSKNRRKHERKKFRLKEGSPFEDLAIINELFVLYSNMNTLLQEVGRVLRGESLISKDWNRAKQLQIKADKAAKVMEEKKKIIWNFVPQNKNKESCDQNYGPSATTEMIISQVNKDKDEFFINRYMELDAKLRNAPDVFESSWKLDMLK